MLIVKGKDRFYFSDFVYKYFKNGGGQIDEESIENINLWRENSGCIVMGSHNFGITQLIKYQNVFPEELNVSTLTETYNKIVSITDRFDKNYKEVDGTGILYVAKGDQLYEMFKGGYIDRSVEEELVYGGEDFEAYLDLIDDPDGTMDPIERIYQIYKLMDKELNVVYPIFIIDSVEQKYKIMYKDGKVKDIDEQNL